MTTEKARENRLRRKAARLGLVLEKSRRRDPDALDYGLYGLRDPSHGGMIHPHLADMFPHALTLDDVEAYLSK